MELRQTTRLLAFAALVLALAVGASACDPSGDSTTNNNRPLTNANAIATASPSPSASMNQDGMKGMEQGSMKSSPNAASAPYDLQFIDTMIAHHQSAIEMAKMAEIKAEHGELEEFARKLVTDQEKETAQLKSWREQWFSGKAPAINMEMKGMMDSMMGMDMNKMNAASGNAFDLMFIDMMTPHHQGAITMSREALTKAGHSEIKKFAQTMIDMQQAEIKTLQAWKSQWSK